jgi:hypothetical protein
MTRHEDGGILTGFLLRTVIGFALVIGIVFEGGAVIFSKVQADSISIEAAEKAAEQFGVSGSTAKATEVAEEVTRRRGAELLSLEVLEGEEYLRATVRVRAKTFLIHRIGPLKKYATSTAVNRGRVP